MKKYALVGACGLSCGLCTRYYTEGKTRCEGCGSAYSYAAVGCSIYRCCIKEKNLETCAECTDFPCQRFEGAIVDYDSFITHRKILPNLRYIKEHGIEDFLREQTKRKKLLEQMLGKFNDGRSRSYYCVATTMLSVEALEQSLAQAKKKVTEESIRDLKGKAKILKEIINEFATMEGVDLKLRKPSRNNS